MAIFSSAILDPLLKAFLKNILRPILGSIFSRKRNSADQQTAKIDFLTGKKSQKALSCLRSPKSSQKKNSCPEDEFGVI
jgi:hypothetical protein